MDCLPCRWRNANMNLEFAARLARPLPKLFSSSHARVPHFLASALPSPVSLHGAQSVLCRVTGQRCPLRMLSPAFSPAQCSLLPRRSLAGFPLVAPRGSIRSSPFALNNSHSDLVIPVGQTLRRRQLSDHVFVPNNRLSEFQKPRPLSSFSERATRTGQFSC